MLEDHYSRIEIEYIKYFASMFSLPQRIITDEQVLLLSRSMKTE